MKKRFLLCSLVFLLCVVLCSSQQAAAQQNSTILELSSEIHTTLDNLKRQSEDLTLQLTAAKTELEISSNLAGELRTELDGLNSSLRNTSAKLDEYSRKLSVYEVKLKRRAKIIAWAAVLMGLFILTRVVLAIMKLKFGVSIPYWLNLLL